MSCDRPRDLPRHAIGEVDHVAHVGRLDDVAMVRIAVAEVIEQIDVGRHAVAEIDQDIGESLLHLRFGAAVARRLVAFEPREHRGGDVELDRQFVVRDGGRDLVDLALERVVIERVDRAHAASSTRNSQITECAGTRSTWNFVPAGILPAFFSRLNSA